MKQVLQNLQSGVTSVEEVPAPACSKSRLLVQTKRTLISAGTEKMLVEFGQAGLIGKARAQPEKVRQVLAKIKTDGLWPTLDAVFSKLGEPLPLGYCSAGVISEVGVGVTGYEVGQRVISNGPHAEFASVPPLLTAAIPENVNDEEACFTVLASIGLQGVRLIQPTLGECVVVYGLGLIGLVAVQLLKSNGCRVIGVDINEQRLALAREFGAEVVDARNCEDVATRVAGLTAGLGADAVLITASAKTDAIVSDSARMCRKRGRVVLVGVVGLQLSRTEFYEKEISFQVSCSYGPGRYDENYESKNQDYPVGFVRWTQQRNFETILQLLAERRLDFRPLITHRFALENAQEAYSAVQQDPQSLGVVIEYSGDAKPQPSLNIGHSTAKPVEHQPVVAIVGAGNFTRATLMPALAKCPLRIKYIAGRSNMAGVQSLAKKNGVEIATSDLDAVLNDEEVDLVLLTTNHDTHAAFASQFLRAGKHVFVEKPLALNETQLAGVIESNNEVPDRNIMVGFNRRFSPHSIKCMDLLRGRSEPLAITMNINAGAIPGDHWVHDQVVGGGRIIGEACHFLDLVVFLSGSRITSIAAHRMGAEAAIRDDKVAISGGCEDGSVFSVNYFANGSSSFPKELFDIYSDGRVLRVNNFRETTGFGFKGFRRLRTSRQEKGHREQFQAMCRAIASGEPLIPFDEIVNSTLASFASVESAKEAVFVDIAQAYADLLSN